MTKTVTTSAARTAAACVGLILLATALPTRSSAATLLASSFGPNDTNSPAGIAMGGGAGNIDAVGSEFSLSSSAYLTSADIGVWSLSGTSQSFSVSIFSANGALPGAPLETVTATTAADLNPPSGPVSTETPLPSATFSGNTLLEANTDYWMVVSSATQFTSISWQTALTGDAIGPSTATKVEEPTANTWVSVITDPGMAMSISGNLAPVPLPAAAWLLISGLGSLGRWFL